MKETVLVWHSNFCQDMLQVYIYVYIYYIQPVYEKWKTQDITTYVMLFDICLIDLLCSNYFKHLDIQFFAYVCVSWNHSSSFQFPLALHTPTGQCLCCLERRWHHHRLGRCYWRCRSRCLDVIRTGSIGVRIKQSDFGTCNCTHRYLGT